MRKEYFQAGLKNSPHELSLLPDNIRCWRQKDEIIKESEIWEADIPDKSWEWIKVDNPSPIFKFFTVSMKKQSTMILLDDCLCSTLTSILKGKTESWLNSEAFAYFIPSYVYSLLSRKVNLALQGSLEQDRRHSYENHKHYLFTYCFPFHTLLLL